MLPPRGFNDNPTIIVSLLGEGKCVRFISSFRGSPIVLVRMLEREGGEWTSTQMSRPDAVSLYRELRSKGYSEPKADPDLHLKTARNAALPVEGNGRYS